MREIKQLVVHCSATSPTVKVNAQIVRAWHLQKGWRDIGYSHVICRDGTVELGRPMEQVGAHVEGHNANSTGICMAGGVAKDNKTPEDNFTPAQWASLSKLLHELLTQFPKATVLGHRDFPQVAKACPSFSVRAKLGPLGFPIDPLAK